MQMQLPTMGRVNKFLVIAVVSLFLINSIAKLSGFPLLGIVGLSASQFFSGHVYQLLTFSFMPTGLMEVIFDALIFWFIGSELEELWGEKRYIQFLVVTALGGGIIYLGLSLMFSSSLFYTYPLSGPAGVCSALCVAFGVLFPERQMYLYIFPVKAKWFVLILIGISLYQGFFSPGGVLAWYQLGAMACGYGWMLFVSSPKFKDWEKKSKLSKLKKKPSHLRVVKDDDDITYH